MVTGQHWRPPFPSSPSLLHAYQKNSEEPAQVVCQFTVINVMMHIYVISFVSTICENTNAFERLPVSKLCSLMSNLFTRHNRPNCIRGNVAMLCGPSQGWISQGLPPAEVYFGLSFQSEGSTQRQEEFSSICKGYQFRVSHYAYTQVLTRIFGLSDWNGKTGGNPTCCQSVCRISRTYSHCQSESKV